MLGTSAPECTLSQGIFASCRPRHWPSAQRTLFGWTDVAEYPFHILRDYFAHFRGKRVTQPRRTRKSRGHTVAVDKSES
jgi:hypothetical protein